MGEVGWVAELQRKFRARGLQIASVILDGVFFIIWAAVQHLVNRVIEWLNLSNTIDQWVLLTLQVIFAISTIAPLLIFLVEDIVILIRGVQKEKGENRTEANDG